MRSLLCTNLNNIAERAPRSVFRVLHFTIHIRTHYMQCNVATDRAAAAATDANAKRTELRPASRRSPADVVLPNAGERAVLTAHRRTPRTLNAPTTLLLHNICIVPTNGCYVCVCVCASVSYVGGTVGVCGRFSTAMYPPHHRTDTL